MKILVTGGAGFIGSALCRYLSSAGHEVTVLDNLSRGKAERLNGCGVRVISGDVRYQEQVEMAMHGAEVTYHLAYLQGTQTFYSEPAEVLEVATQGMLSVLAACKREACGELILASSSEAYQVASVVPTPETIPLSVPDITNPRYSYGVGKILSEAMVLAWQRKGILDRAVIARPHNIIGPDMGAEHVVPEFALRMNDLVQLHPTGVIPFPIQGTGHETRSFCYIDDCVLQLAALLSAPTGVYHVGTMDERTIEDVALQVAASYLRNIKIQPGALPKGSPPRRLPDTAKIRELMGDTYPDPVTFDVAIARTVDWYRGRTFTSES